MRLKRSEIRKYREKLLKQQNNRCALCSKELTKEEATLDHQHFGEGRVRKVLCFGCNRGEGIAKNAERWSGNKGNPSAWLRRLADYWEEDYSHNPVHPQHKTDEMKKIRQLKQRLKKAKRERTKQRIRDEIKRLQAM